MSTNFDTTNKIAQSIARREAANRILTLFEQGYDITTLTRRLSITRSYFSHLMSGRRKTAWLRVALAQLALVPYLDFWGCGQPELSAADVEKLRQRGLIEGAADAGSGGSGA